MREFIAKWLHRFAGDMASQLKKELLATRSLAMNRLETIVVRQRKSRLRDLAFAAFVVLVGACSIATVQTAAHNAAHDVAQR
jgi:hypothetical protein